MGKKIIIPGANFADNGMAATFDVLDYIVANSDTQLIYSGVNIALKTKVVWDFAVADNTAAEGNVFAGSNFQTADCALGLFLRDTGYLYAYIARNNAVNSIAIGTSRHIAEVSLAGFVVDGTNYAGTLTIPSSISRTENIPILGRTASGQTTKAFPGVRVYGVKIYSDYDDASSLVIDAIPVKKQDGTVCFYNKVNGTYLVTADGTNPSYGV